MRFDYRKVRETFAYLVCLCLLSFAISLCIVTFYDLGNSSKVQECPASRGGGVSSKESVKQPSDDRKDCETIHLALICGGHTATREFYTLLKSILFYRTNANLHLHLFVNNISKTILDSLFKTWIVADLTVDYYQISDYEPDILWIPNKHYSHRYGLLKLVAPTILADAGLRRVIFLDTDMLAFGNIAALWAEFDRFEGAQDAFIGLVENQSDWYLNEADRVTRANSWPALGRGFNTGLMLFQLDRLRSAGWNEMWRELAEKELITRLATNLADQDIFNAAIKRNSWMALKLDCRFNLQLNDHVLLNETCPSHRGRAEFSLVHWNSPFKLSTTIAQSEHYKSWHTTFINWNAKLLERSGCSDSAQVFPVGESEVDTRLEELCRDIRPRPRERLRTFLYFLDFETEQDRRFDVTLVVHLSMDRFWALDELASHWPGPMSVALYLKEMETSQLTELLETTESLSKRRNVAYHLVFQDSGPNYPINRLRNIALNNALTKFVFMTDVDFLPSPNLYGYLRATLEKAVKDDGPAVLQKRAFVVPAFETNEYKFEFPRGKPELIKQLDLGTIFKFRESIWPQGQAAVDYERWKRATQPYKIEWRPEFEPFIMVGANVTRYDERFNGFGWNKVEHIMHLAAAGYEFFVLPEAFSVHQFHPASYDIRKHRESKKYQACIRLLKQTFLAELRRAHPDFAADLTRRLR